MSVKVPDSEAYERARGEAILFIEQFDEPLRATTRAYFEPLTKSSMVKMMTLMPYWVTDLVPTDEAVVSQLSLAHLYVAWYYHAQDDVLDGQAAGNVMLGAHMALLKAVEIYERLDVLTADLRQEFWRLTQLSAESYAVETTSHFTELSELTAERLAPFTTTFIINRLSPIFFNTKAQLYLAGVGVDHSLHGRLLNGLRAMYISLQLGDDMTDWLTDLQAGQINTVAAGLIRHLYAARPETTAADLSLEWLAGYQLTAGSYWQLLEQTITELNQEALSAFEGIEPCRLRDQLLLPHMKQMNSVWPTFNAQRRRLEDIFGL